ncbi:hypothetical protein HYU14_01060 [Candidatus Woesearchaeota archaeon]|nr:hypothetical protein [Candidatus Woesearchaeota archaeon]
MHNKRGDVLGLNLSWMVILAALVILFIIAMAMLKNVSPSWSFLPE